MHPDRAYLSIESWPEPFDEPRRTDAMRSLLSIEPYRAKELARRATPAIFARVVIEQGEQATLQLRAWGARAACIPGTAILSMQAPLPARPAMQTPEGLEFKLWKGDPVRIEPAKLVALVRAHARIRKGHADGDFGVHGLHQLHGTLGAEAWDQGPTRRAHLHVTELLDLHTIDGIHVRVSGDRFGFEVLGEARRKTPRENIDALASLISTSAESLQIDSGFESARFIGEFTHDFGVTEDWKSAAGFGVYSAWRACMAIALREADLSTG